MFLDKNLNLKEQSHKKIKIKCDFEISKKCRKIYEIPYRDALVTRRNNNNKDICLFCSRKLKSSGRNNPNCKYVSLDDNFFENIDSEEKAYLLGWIGSDGCITERGFSIDVHKKDIEILEKLKNIICKDLKIKNKIRKSIVSLTINSKSIAKDLIKIFNIDYGKKSETICFPELDNDNLKWCFLRGYFDGDGSIRKPSISNYPECKITSSSLCMLEGIKDFCTIPSFLGKDYIGWTSNNALDFLGKIYENTSLYLKRKKELYDMWSSYFYSTFYANRIERKDNIRPIFKWCKKDSKAIAPFKSRVSDSGYDLTLINLSKKDGIFYLYDTGISIQPEFGWYIEIVPRSSLSKTGFVLANSVAIIDRTYNGNIFIPLLKVDTNKPDIELPFRAVQAIPKQIINCAFIEVPIGAIGHTERNNKGFGSTG